MRTEVSEEGIRTDSVKVEKVRSCPVPILVKDMPVFFWGFFRRYVKEVICSH